ncbi:ATP-binding protein [Roseovarius sp. Pro17]|uniref:ATP-binding protein n=1 Tax=Roseovarius sp. Pro17 TaxID=3108175 RepID=UPI002D78DC24|nr:ATP-binding protein [Roseovarius sp. Pro17]
MTGEILSGLLRQKGGKLFHRESRTLEFKEQFNLAGLADYFRDFAAFANNIGGYIVFGVKDSPRIPLGLLEKSWQSFEKVDPEKTTGFLGRMFSSEIGWQAISAEIGEKKFAAFKIDEARIKPLIALQDSGKDQIIRNGDVYYRYGGRSQRILSGELQAIISNRIEDTNQSWIDHVRSIGPSGPQSAIVLRDEIATLDRQHSSLVIDSELARKLKFIKEGEFSESSGAETLKLVGDVVPVNALEVERTVEQNLLAKYPYSSTEVWKRVKRAVPTLKQPDFWRTINCNKMKGDIRYSKYNFRNLQQEQRYRDSGYIPSATPVIYNEDAIAFLINLFRNIQ